jgi:hypothetical protein
METVLSIFLGIGLSAACGFRIFVPFLAMSVASLLGYLPLSEGFEWIGTVPALLTFATATMLEVAAYYIPWLDNLMDSVATPAAFIAGVVASASVLTDLPPLVRWSVALIAGGGVAGIIQGSTVLLRTKSSLLTGGIGNALVATGELIGSALTSLLSLAVPVVSAILVFLFLLLTFRLTGRLLFGRRHISYSPTEGKP